MVSDSLYIILREKSEGALLKKVNLLFNSSIISGSYSNTNSSLELRIKSNERSSIKGIVVTIWK